jgi:hypothetical protein
MQNHWKNPSTSLFKWSILKTALNPEAFNYKASFHLVLDEIVVLKE